MLLNLIFKVYLFFIISRGEEALTSVCAYFWQLAIPSR
jgi:hypothetical protein